MKIRHKALFLYKDIELMCFCVFMVLEDKSGSGESLLCQSNLYKWVRLRLQR